MQYNQYNSFLIGTFVIILFLLSISCKDRIPVPRANHNSANAAEASSSQIVPPQSDDPNDMAWTRPRSDERIDERQQMVHVLQRQYGMTDPNILQAMLDVPRHWFVPDSQQRVAYYDGPQPIGYGQTISQPFIVAYMTQLLDLSSESKVLEIGTGSGYQAAVLSEFTPHVYTIEIVEPLGKRAVKTFKQRRYKAIRAKVGDGYKGWPEHAPFDAVIVTCAPDHIPQPLVNQLKPGGKIVIPVGSRWGVQDLMLVTKKPDGTLKRESKMPVRFVPLTRDKE